MLKLKNIFIIFLIPLIYFIASVITLKDYGINWDEPLHYMRGQAYFRYLTTGKKDYVGIKEKISYFQNASMDANYFLKTDSGHPPANAILATLFNEIFFKKLGIVGDLESYHLFIVFVSSLAVLAVALFAYEVLGLLGSVIAALIFATYPLFFAEAHFNIKDPIETAFYTLTIWSFWKSLQKGNWRWLIASLVFCALALGTKFNILFLPLIILPYLVIRYGKRILKVKDWFRKIPNSYKICLLISPIIVVGIFVYLWPFLWTSPIKNFIGVLSYYKDIGTGLNYQALRFLFMKFNLYAIFWIIVTTPPIVLFFAAVGTISVFFRKGVKEKTSYLWLLWFLLPIARVTVPDTSIYGGVRQIMEYIPGMALVSAFGADTLVRLLKTKFGHYKLLSFIIIFPTFVLLILPIWKYHPNENVYFNSLIGGLEGAKSRDIPSWGNSFGNAYWQAIEWLNGHASENARLALVQGTGGNLSGLGLRKDIIFSNTFWTGIRRGGEYLLELTGEQTINPYPYPWEYVNKMLKPVYEVKAGGVAIAKLWKNDLVNTVDEFQKPEVKLFNYQIKVQGKEINVIFGKEFLLTKFFLHYKPDRICKTIYAKIRTSVNGSDWSEEKDALPSYEQVSVPDLPPNSLSFFFAARSAKYIKIITLDENSCLLKNTYFDIWALE